MILDKFREKDLLENFPGILDEFSEYFRFSHIINYLLTGLLMLNREIQSPQFLRMLASSFRTSKL